MKRLLAILCLVPVLALVNPTLASAGELVLDHAPDISNDNARLQHGAKLFVNYCLNCHGASLMRYNRLRDIGLSDDQIKANLLFTADKVGEPMKIAMAPKDAKAWFGATPPDLSVIARARSSEAGSGSDWLYSYLRKFYRDDSRPTGWNNVVFPNVGMPHVLWDLQGQRAAKFVKEKDEHDPSKVEVKFEGFEQLTPGSLSETEYDVAVADLVGYLQFMAEPSAIVRKRLGVGVLMFLAIFLVITWRLNAAYWKDVK